MKSKKERLENLELEEFYLNFFDGTLMPNNPKYINIVMFNDTFYVGNEKEEKENYGDMYFIIQVKKLIQDNLDIIKEMRESKGQPVKSSYNHKLCIKINNEMYMVDRNICNQEGQKLFDEFKIKLYEILDINI